MLEGIRQTREVLIHR